MIVYIITLFIIIALYNIFLPKEDKYSKLFFISLGVILIITAGILAQGLTKDYQNYLNAYYKTSGFSSIRFEPTFVILTIIVKSVFNNPVYLFLIYAIIGVSLKFIAIKQLTNLYLLSVLIYLSNFFILHEMTQIRVGVAASILLLCIKPLYERNFKIFILLAVIAISFHYTALAILPLWFLKPKEINRNFYLLLIPATYIFVLSGITLGNLLQYFPLKSIQNLYYMHLVEMKLGIIGFKINILNSLQILRCFICFFLIINIEKLSSINKYATILVKIYALGIVSFLIFSDFPVVSFRISQLFEVVEIILLPFMIYLFRPAYLASLIPIGVGMIELYIILFYEKLI